MNFETYMNNQKKWKWLGVFVILSGFALVLLTGFYPVEVNPDWSAFHPLRSTASSIGIGMIGFGANTLRKSRKIRKNEAFAKEQFIKENDEYQSYIDSQTSKLAIILTIVILAIGAAIAWFFDLTVAATLLGAFWSVSLLYFIIWGIYRLKPGS